MSLTPSTSSTSAAYRMTRRVLGLVAVVLALAIPAHAQAPTSYTLKISNQGAAAPFTSAVLPASGFTCGVTPKIPPFTTTSVNPSKVVIDDPAAPTTADCIYTDPGTGPILSLPFGTQIYTSTISATYPAGPSPDSLVSNPFSRPGVVGSAPTGLRMSR